MNGEPQPKCQGVKCGGEGVARYGVKSYDEPNELVLFCESCKAGFPPCVHETFLPLDCSDLKWEGEIER